MLTDNNRPPLISVILVSYEHEKFVVEALESVKNQTLQDFELIYCDDASPDRSAQVAADWLSKQTFPTRLILHEKSQGLCRTLNEALSLARGKYIQMMACDDVLMPEKFERQVALLETPGEDTIAVHSDAYLINGDGSPKEPGIYSAYKGYSFPPPEPLFANLLDVCRFAAFTVLVRKDKLLETGDFDPRLACEDWDMGLRMARSHKVVASDYLSAKYRVHGRNFHLTRLKDDQHYWLVRKHLSHPAAQEKLTSVLVTRIERGIVTDAELRDWMAWMNSKSDLAPVFKQVLDAVISAWKIARAEVEQEKAKLEDLRKRVAKSWFLWFGRLIKKPFYWLRGFSRWVFSAPGSSPTTPVSVPPANEGSRQQEPSQLSSANQGAAQERDGGIYGNTASKPPSITPLLRTIKQCCPC